MNGIDPGELLQTGLHWVQDNNFDWYVECPCCGHTSLADVELIDGTWAGSIVRPVKEYGVARGRVGPVKEKTLARLREILRQRGQIW